MKRTKVCTQCGQRLNIDKFYKTSSYCIKCQKSYVLDYKEKNKSSINRKLQEKLATEKGMINIFYISIKNKKNSFLRKMKKGKVDLTEKQIEQFYDCKVTEEELLEIWREQFKKYGMHCPYTGKVMTFLRKNDGRGPGNAYSNTISIDRKNPDLCYEKKNIIFVTNEANLNKNRTNYKIALNIIKVHKDTWPDIYK